MVSDYERQRDLNKKRNEELLLQLGLEKPFFEPKEQLRKKQVKEKESKKEQTKKRKLDDDDFENDDDDQEEEDEEEKPRPRKALKEDNAENSSLRRSSRNRGKKMDYQREKKISSPFPKFVDTKETENSNVSGGGKMNRTQNPKTYGSIPGVEVGTWWATREGCSADAIHAPWVGGIAVGPHGAYSVALSGGYDDDVDVGYAFTYTGSGGRDLKGTKNAPKNLRTAPQSSDQTFDNNFNKALKRSSETRKPVRVVRGFKLQSKYGPSEGYRYDGLYYIEKAWIEPGLNAGRYKVCKYAFKRLPGQPPLPVRNTEEDEDGGSADGEAEDDPDHEVQGQSEAASEAVEDEES
ncbi:hypothetical protein BDN72DRAFT_25255 [Pluteus cervinus]|uniref:Uncharacterized protein n=1 Tax=Pluteus cervinus TaxID=181527 RepID=A0ACD3BGQ7_9AGAR|nr:hypothetical protein BDN72DRAFT_25255 [Pluteus cervinus]